MCSSPSIIYTFGIEFLHIFEAYSKNMKSKKIIVRMKGLEDMDAF